MYLFNDGIYAVALEWAMSVQITPGWKFLHIGFEGEAVSYKGIDLWKNTKTLFLQQEKFQMVFGSFVYLANNNIQNLFYIENSGIFANVYIYEDNYFFLWSAFFWLCNFSYSILENL